MPFDRSPKPAVSDSYIGRNNVADIGYGHVRPALWALPKFDSHIYYMMCITRININEGKSSSDSNHSKR
jgi:hypothetical protein